MTKVTLKKGRLSNEDFELFKELIYLSDEELSVKLKRNVSFIEKTRKRVYPNQKTGRWSKAEVIKLSNNSNFSLEQLSRLLNRKEKAIETKLKSEKVKNLKEAKKEKSSITETIEKFKEKIVFDDKTEKINNTNEKESKKEDDSLISVIEDYKEEIVFDDNTGTVEINGSKHIPFEKHIWIPKKEKNTEEKVEEIKLSFWQKIVKFFTFK